MLLACAACLPVAAQARADKATLNARLPSDKTVLACCNTSSFAGQVAMALRMDGYENVRLLHGGYNEWKARGGRPEPGRALR